jgi:hypothetical protein
MHTWRRTFLHDSVRARILYRLMFAFFFFDIENKIQLIGFFFLVEKCFENNCQKKIRKTSREASTFLRAIWLIIHNNVKIAKVSAISTKTSIKFDVISLQVLNHCYPKTTTAKKKGD